jgi:hypothetical protein
VPLETFHKFLSTDALVKPRTSLRYFKVRGIRTLGPLTHRTIDRMLATLEKWCRNEALLQPIHGCARRRSDIGRALLRHCSGASGSTAEIDHSSNVLDSRTSSNRVGLNHRTRN